MTHAPTRRYRRLADARNPELDIGPRDGFTLDLGRDFDPSRYPPGWLDGIPEERDPEKPEEPILSDYGFEAYVEPPRPPRPPRPPNNFDVNVERDDRVMAGNTFEVEGYGPVRISGDDTTIRNLQGLAFGALLRIQQGDTTTLTPFRDDDDIIHQLTPSQLVDLWQKGAAFVSAVFMAAWAIKDDPTGIGAGYKNDPRWPSQSAGSGGKK